MWQNWIKKVKLNFAETVLNIFQDKQNLETTIGDKNVMDRKIQTK